MVYVVNPDVPKDLVEVDLYETDCALSLFLRRSTEGYTVSYEDREVGQIIDQYGGLFQP
jgi:hypothetical protein